jgi:hypothetical protein
MFIKYLNTSFLDRTSVFSEDRISFGREFQSLAAENPNEVSPHLVLTGGKSSNVNTLVILR